MPQPTPDSFEFRGLRFSPVEASIKRVSDAATFSVRPKQQALLTALLSQPGETVTYEYLWKKIWPEIEDFVAVRRTMTETKSNLDKLLRSILKTNAQIIQTISGQGYCIKGLVTKHGPQPLLIDEPPAVTPANSDPFASPVRPESPAFIATPKLVSGLLGPHPWHIIGSCAIYGAAYVCILLLETAYGSEHFSQALSLSPLVFLWIVVTSIAALVADWKLTFKRNANALTVLILSFLAAALVLYGMLSFFLPAIPVTQATFQAQTAQGAFLKNVALYFLPLVTLYLLIPFHLVASLRSEMATGRASKVRDLLLHRRRAGAPPNAIYISPKTLGFVLLVVGIACLPGTYWLLDHLKPGPYMNRFTVFVVFRLILYFGLGAECLLWYTRTLNQIKNDLD